MMTYNEFKDIVDLMVKHNQKLDSAYKLKINLLEAFEEIDKAINLMWDQILTTEGVDWLNWFLYEKGYINDGIGRKDLQAWDENKNPICEDLKGLYDYLKSSGCIN